MQVQETYVTRGRRPNPCLTICLVICAFIFPPLAVVIVDGCGIQLLINILLYIFTFWIGAVIHALFVIAAGHERGTVVQKTTTTSQPVTVVTHA